ncbi:MAG TPA: hypothetical protein VK115_01660 [Staphylococcus sp.]|nr:hypothetical protein [Staphylococcus sp.]
MFTFCKALGISFLIGSLVLLLMFIATGKDEYLGSIIVAIVAFLGNFISFYYERNHKVNNK